MLFAKAVLAPYVTKESVNIHTFDNNMQSLFFLPFLQSKSVGAARGCGHLVLVCAPKAAR